MSAQPPGASRRGVEVEIKKIMIGSARIVSQLLLAFLPYFTKVLVPVTDI